MLQGNDFSRGDRMSLCIPGRLSGAALLTVLLILLAFSPPASQAQGDLCVSFRSYTENWLYADNPSYILFPSSRYLTPKIRAWDDSGCTVRTNYLLSGFIAWVYATSESQAENLCSAGRGVSSGAIPLHVNDDENRIHNRNIWTCVSSGRKSGGSSQEAKSQPRYPTCEQLQMDTDIVLNAVDGFHSGIQCQRLDAGGIGNQSVIDQGFLDAVDVWGVIGGGYEVCFPQNGRLLFLDAANSPRTAEWIEVERRNGYTCATRATAGTLALVEPTEADTQTETQPSNALVRESVSSAVDLANCQVTTDYNLNFRAEPGGSRVGLAPANTMLTASRRTASWFEVNYDEREGWISAWYVTTEGDCDYNSVM